MIASAGWVFDAYEGQIFTITRGDMLAEVMQVPKDSPADSPEMKQIKQQGDNLFAVFLLGGAWAESSSARWPTAGGASRCWC